MRIQILGAGIVGLTCAWELGRRGHDVTVVDPAPGSGASHAAAGMLCPAGELWHGEVELFRLGQASAALWPTFAAELGVPLHRTGTLLTAADAGDLQEVDRQLGLLAAAGIRAESLTRRELVAREPGLGRVAGGAYLPDQHSVDPRAVIAALLARVPVVSTGSITASGSTPGGRACRDHPTYDANVIATGARLPEPFAHLVRPVRGEVLRVRSEDPPRHVVRGLVHGEPVYVVPRADSSEVVIGATSEEHDAAPVPTVEGVHRLLDAARQLLPGLDRGAFVEAIARDRPGTADNVPLVGPISTSSIDGERDAFGGGRDAFGGGRVVLAAGHYRHGVLLAPLTAQLVADHLESGAVDPAVDPRRFTFERSAV